MYYVSGSAYKLSRDCALTHGTMLIDSDLANLGRYLTSKTVAITGGGHTSYRSKVTNLKMHCLGITVDGFFHSVGNMFANANGLTEQNV
jgi:lipoate---protein ligase